MQSRFLEDKEFTAAMNHILINCDEIQPYIEQVLSKIKTSSFPNCDNYN
jgi:hypothetical protein